MNKPDFTKGNGLVPAVIQDDISLKVLMLGYMNEEAYEKTISDGFVTFFSRSKCRLWKKGETSGNFLKVVSISNDCDSDALLIKVIPSGPVCHTGSYSCFGETGEPNGFLYKLEKIVNDRIDSGDQESYTNRLYNKGLKRVAQKVGEEAVELVIGSTAGDKAETANEAADLLYHFLILLKARSLKLSDIEAVLAERHRQKTGSAKGDNQ
ncbi:MAG: bifunctional phosphoribosyl-AMP cyclohydrolase/phosphoribosyl-ATP diphosphatase HisIE [Bacteroidales bacterium]